VSDILAESEDSVDLLFWVGQVGRLGRVEQPTSDVDIVYTWNQLVSRRYI